MSRAFWVLLKREFEAFLFSPMAYVIFFCFTLVNGFSFQFCAEIMTQGVPNFTIMQIFFQIFYFWFVVIIMIPLLTMRLFSEEYRMGTIELLLTAPVTDWDVVLSKFLAVVGYYIFLWLPSAVYLLAYQLLTEGQMPVFWGPLLLSYLMVLLIGLFYSSIGLFASSLTKNQAIAAFISFCMIALLFFLSFLSFTSMGSKAFDFLNYLSVRNHMSGYADGIFDTRPLVWYLSGTVLFLALTQRVMAARKLKD